jgi:hypothetical protein
MDPEEVLRSIRAGQVDAVSIEERVELTAENIEDFERQVESMTDPDERDRMRMEVVRMRQANDQQLVQLALLTRVQNVEVALLYLADRLGQVERELGLR